MRVDVQSPSLSEANNDESEDLEMCQEQGGLQVKAAPERSGTSAT